MTNETIRYDELVELLTIKNYCYNRRRSPDIPLSDWRKVYGTKVEEYEVYYQLEKEAGSA